MARRPARISRTVLVLGTCLAMACALVAVAGAADAARRPAPTHFRSPGADQTSVTVRWHKVRKAPGYRVRWSTRHSMGGSRGLATTTHRVRIGGLTPNTRYFVQVAVAAHHGHGRRLGPWSRILERRTPAAPCPVADLGSPTPAVPTGQPTDLRVATFNIRTMSLDSPDQPTQRWRNRADRVAALLLGAATSRNPATAPPDVVAVQEANQSYKRFGVACTNQFIDLRNRLNADGAHHYEGTSLSPAASVGTRILFDTNRLRLETAGSILLASPKTTHPHLAWAIFQARNGGQRFFFGSVHLVPDEDAGSDAVRDAEWDRLIGLLSDPSLTQGLPVVLAGDFNARRSDTTHTSALTHLPRMAAAGFADSLLGNLDPAPRDLDVSDARPASTANAHCSSTNGFRILQHCAKETTRIAQDLDYVFASNALPVKRWEVVLDLDDENNWLGTIPSDHNLVRTTITLPGVTG